MPDAQLRITVQPGTLWPQPIRSATTRPMLTSSGDGAAQPRITSSSVGRCERLAQQQRAAGIGREVGRRERTGPVTRLEERRARAVDDVQRPCSVGRDCLCRAHATASVPEQRRAHTSARRPTAIARRPPAAGLRFARRAHWVTCSLTQPRRGAAVGTRLARPRVDCLLRWPCEGPHETRSARGAARPRRATGCRAKVCEPERLSMSDPRGLAAGQVLLQLAGGCP